MVLKRAALFLLLITFTVTLTNSAEAKRHRRRHRSRVKRAVINEPVLFERMGGSKVVSQLVDEWLRSSLADGRLSGSFGDVQAKPELLVGMRKRLNAQLCELADGPCSLKAEAKLESKALKKSPDLMALDDDHFVIFADHLAQTMDQNKVREREKNEMLGRIGEARSGADEADDTATE